MVKMVEGDFFDSKAEVLIFPCNCSGSVKDDFTKKFKSKFEKYFESYSTVCSYGFIRIGKCLEYYTDMDCAYTSWVISLPCRKNGREIARIEDVIASLRDLKDLVGRLRVRHVAIPVFDITVVNSDSIEDAIKSAFLELRDVKIEIYKIKTGV